jgi:ubiquinone/menaquinone biosynthesis C-methylase UbiE
MGDLYARFRGASDEQWYELLRRSVDQPVIDGIRVPGFPSSELQVLSTSHAWDDALAEAFAFFRIVKEACAARRQPVGPRTRLLDFGVGWGRIIRMFLKDVRASGIHGVDVSDLMVSTCRSIMPVGTYEQCRHGEPLPFADASFDVVTAFSVFSHLSPTAQMSWLRELARVLAPGGIAVVTTLSQRVVDDFRAAAAEPEQSEWHRSIGQLVHATYPDWRERLQRRDDVMYYLPAGGGLAGLEAAHYGWAIVGAGYARAAWSELFAEIEYVDDAARLDQAWFVLRVPARRWWGGRR